MVYRHGCIYAISSRSLIPTRTCFILVSGMEEAAIGGLSKPTTPQPGGATEGVTSIVYTQKR
jgi:hypothetical protein